MKADKIILYTVFESNAPIGSSNNNITGFLDNTLAIDSHSCSSTNNSDGNLSTCSSNLTSFWYFIAFVL